jgi:hypothetical protein
MPRFTIRNLLIGTAIFSLWGTLVLNHNQIVDSSPILVGPLWLSLFLLPFVATGYIVGNAMSGLRVAFFLLVVFTIIAALLVLTSFTA